MVECLCLLGASVLCLWCGLLSTLQSCSVFYLFCLSPGSFTPVLVQREGWGWERSRVGTFCSYSLSGSCSLFFKNVLEASGNKCWDACAALPSCPQLHCSWDISGNVTLCKKGGSNQSLLTSNGKWRAALKLHGSVRHLQVTVLALGWKCSWKLIL